MKAILNDLVSWRKDVDSRLQKLAQQAQFISRNLSSESHGEGHAKDSGKDNSQSLQPSPSIKWNSLTWSSAIDELAGDRSQYLLTQSSHYVFQFSVWDLSILVGLREVGGFLGSTWIAMLTVLNIAIQLTLCLIINDSLTSPNIDDGTLNDLKNWRTFSGHSWTFVDKQSFQPLAKRICSFDGSVPMSSGVADVLHTIAGYAPTAGDRDHQDPFLGHLMPYFSGVGQLMSVLATTIWCLNVAIDLKDTMTLSKSLNNLSTGGRTHIQISESGVALVEMSLMRKLYCAFIIFIKVAVSASLCFFGILYLAFTLEIGELLLNAVALQIVLDFDETLYAASAPDRSSRLLRSLKPLREPTYTVWGLNSRALLLGILGLVVPWLTVPFLLEPQAQILVTAREEICGGNVNFVALTDRMGIVRADVVPSHSDEPTYEFMAMRQLIEDPRAISLALGQESCFSEPTSGLVGTLFGMDYAARNDAKEMGSVWNSICIDILSPEGRQRYIQADIFQLILEETSGQAIESCLSINEYCNWDATVGVRARQVCPVTCGCSDPGSGLVVERRNACPNTCTSTETYTQAMLSRVCVDESTDSKRLSEYAQGLKGMSLSWPLSWRIDLDTIRVRIETMGCGVVATGFGPGELLYPWEDVCELSESWYLKPLTYVCPVSCNCSMRMRPLCPVTCAAIK